MAIINSNEILFGVIASIGEENVPQNASISASTVSVLIADAEYSTYAEENEEA